MSPNDSGGKAARSKTRSVPRANERRALVVIGMHRSGTSALTRVLGLLGATLPKNLMPATENNPLGFFESQPLRDIHEELFHEAGTSWSDVAPFPANWEKTPVATHWIERLREAAEEEFADSPLFVLKDPRIAKLIPVWEQVFKQLNVDPSYVIAVRNPLDVAASLKQAQGIEESKGLLLWLQYFLAGEFRTRSRNRCFQSYEALISDWRAVSEDISTKLGIVFPQDGRSAEARIDRFLSSDLRHHAAPTAEVSTRHDVTEWVRQVYDWAGDATRGNLRSTRTLDRIRRALDAAESVYGPVLSAVELRRVESDQYAKKLEAETGDLRETLTESQREAREVTTQLAGSDQLVALSHRFSDARDPLSVRDDDIGRLIDLVKYVLRAAFGQLDETATHELSTALGGTALAPQTLSGLQLSRQDNEISALREDIARLHAHVSTVEEVERTRQESAERAVQVSQLSTEVGQLRDATTRRDVQLNHLGSEVIGLRQAVDRRDDRIEQLKEQSAENLRAKDLEERARLTLEQRIRDLEARNTELSEKGRRAHELRLKMDEQKEKLVAHSTELQGKLQHLKGELTSRTEKLSEHRDQSRSQQAKLNQQAAALRAEESRIADLQTELQNSKADFSSLSEELTDREFYIRELRAKLDTPNPGRLRRLFKFLSRGS